MHHEAALQSRAVERYLGGELPVEERDSFEEHYFSCPECAEQVRLGAIFLANARAVFAGEKPGRPVAASAAASSGQSWWTWLWMRPAAGMAFAALVVGFAISSFFAIQYKGQFDRANAPQAFPSFALRSLTRGDEQTIEVPAAARFVGLSLDLPDSGAFRKYRCELSRDGAPGPVTFTAPAPPPPGTTINLEIPASLLHTGRYTLLLRGEDSAPGSGSRQESSFQYHFRIQH